MGGGPVAVRVHKATRRLLYGCRPRRTQRACRAAMAGTGTRRAIHTLL